jgi:biopolymer transport protein ExbB
MRRTEGVSPSGRKGHATTVGVLICTAVLLASASGVQAAELDQAATRPGAELPFNLGRMERIGRGLFRAGLSWYERTPPADRVCWGGMVACAGLGLGVLVERLLRSRGKRIVPPDFTERFLDRLHEGKLDGGKALDYCEMNPSPAARVALGAVRRWGRPPADLERAVSLAHRVESERLRVNVGTLRRIAALAPLLGVLGTLLALARVLEAAPQAGQALAAVPWGRALAAALSPLTAGIAIGTLALVSYDILYARIERLTGALDRLGAETIDAIAMVTPPAVPSVLATLLHARPGEPKHGHAHEAHGPGRTPHHQAPSRRRAEVAEPCRPREEHDLGF